ncbi:MAG TPA: helix-turn-helix domain-containing protein, partial [Candidatus Hydrogenedentes bacterium]|nr:helix-turn-helix domain-containing protein [Candidatus Hydrogenedentota bacterium]
QTAHGPLITPEDLTGSVGPLRAPVAEADRPTLDEYEKRYVVRVYEECDGNIAEAARILGVARSTLYHKLGVYGIRV